MRKIDILGTEYTIEMRKRADDENLDVNDGYLDTSVKLLVVEDMQKEKGSKIDLEAYTRQVVRHEIIHAFLFESRLAGCGCSDWAENEAMIDWFAIQAPKIIKVFKAADAL